MAHGLDTQHRTRAQRTAITGGPSIATVPEPGVARVLALPAATPFAARDGVQRSLVAAAMDAQNRIAITKLAPHLGWEDGADLVVRVELGRVRVRPGVPMTPAGLSSQFRSGRLILPAAARARLDIGVGDSVVASTTVGGQLVLVAGTDLAQLADGSAPARPAAPTEPARPVKPRGVKSAWRPPVALNG